MEYGYVLLWIGMFLIVSALGLPLTSALFARLPGRGAGFAPTVSLGVISLVVFWIGQVRFDTIAILVGVFALVAASAVAVRVGVTIDWCSFGESMCVFSAAFGFMVAVHAFDPAILPFIEDFLDYGMMRAVLRTSQLPPEDFWFAGESVRYYYGGHLLAALETRATGTPPPIAYNLAIAGCYAMLVAGAFSLASAVAATNGRSRLLGGALGAYFVGFASNLLAPFTFLLWLLPAPVSRPIATFAAEKTARELEWFLTPQSVVYWPPSRVVEGTINEFPLFSWLHGELHAQMTSAPFFAVVAGICFAYYRTPERERRARRLLVAVAFPLAAGFAMLTDVWTAPTSLGLLWLVLAFAPADPVTLLPDRLRRLRPLPRSALSDHVADRVLVEARRFGGATALSAAVGLLIIVVASPLLLVATGGSESIGIVSSNERATFLSLLLVHGGAVSVLAVFLGVRLVWRHRGDRQTHHIAAPVAVVLLLVLAVATNAMALVLFVPLIAAGWSLLRSDSGGYETVLIVAGAGLAVIPEFIFLSGQEYVASGRMNTVFRAYLQVWILWGVAIGGILPILVRPSNVPWNRLPERETVRVVLVGFLLLSTSVYGSLSTFNHFDRAFEEPDETWEIQGYVYEATQMRDHPNPPTQPPTLDGLLWAEVMHPNETAGIKWLDRNERGTPTIVSAPGGRWEWRSPAASLTGIPTVAGWGHELVYRDWDDYYSRVDDVQRIYEGAPEERIRLLQKYDVEYVYVGRDERMRYDTWEFALLDGVSVEYDRGQRWNESVTVYRVDQSSLAYAPEDIDRRRVEPDELFANRSVSDRRDGHIVASGPNGTLAWYGPEMRLPAGTYEAEFRVAVNETGNGSGTEPVVTVDVVRGAKSRGAADFRVLGNESVGETDGERTVTVPFRLDRPATDVEFRGTLADGNGSVTLYAVDVVHRAENETESGERSNSTQRPELPS